MEAEKKTKATRLSATQLGMYQRCPHQWYLRYVKGLKIPPAGTMIQGRVYHETVADNFKQKMKSGRDISLDELKDRFTDHWKKDVVISEVNWGSDKPQTMRDEGLLLLKCFSEEVAPKIKPASVEETRVKVIIPGKLEVMGITDIIDGKNKIQDHKLANKEKSQNDADRDIQPTLYLWLRPECKTFIYQQVIKKRPTQKMLREDKSTPSMIPYRNVVTTKRSPQQVERFVKMMTDTYQLMQTGIFVPRCDSFWCSERWCGYWGICKARFS